MQSTGALRICGSLVIVAAACGKSIDEQIEACYSHTGLDALPESHPDFDESPAAAADGFEGTFRSEAGDELTIERDGRIEEVRWECDDRSDLPQTPGGASAEFHLPVDLKLTTTDGDFDETMQDTLVVRVDRPNPTEETTQVSTGDNLKPNRLGGDFAPGRAFSRVHWSAAYEDEGWTVQLSAYAPSNGGDTLPFWMHEIRFERTGD